MLSPVRISRLFLGLCLILAVVTTIPRASGVDGWEVTYYNNISWINPAFTETLAEGTAVPINDIRWGDVTSGPDAARRPWPWNTTPQRTNFRAANNNDQFSLRMRGTFTLTAAGSYYFAGRGDDVYCVLVDGKRVINLTANTTWTRSAAVTLLANKPYPIEIWMNQGGGGNYMDLKMDSVIANLPTGTTAMTGPSFPAGTTFGGPVADVRSSNAPNIGDAISPAAGEDLTKLFDGVTNDKWLTTIPATAPANTGRYSRLYATYQYSGGRMYTIASYDWVTGNDCDERDPVSWVLSGSNDGVNWTELDTQTDYAVSTGRNVAMGALITIPVGKRKSFNLHRFDVYKVRGTRSDGSAWTENQCQMAELRLNDVNGTQPAAPTTTVQGVNSFDFSVTAPTPGTMINAHVTPGAGNTVTSYQWHIVDSTGGVPAGAILTGDTTATAAFTNLTAGKYYVWVEMKAANGSGVRYPALDNLFSGAVVTTNSEDANQKAVLADDDTLMTRWMAGNGNDGNYLQFDLGAETYVDRVSIQWHYNNYATRFKILGSKTGKDWALMADRIDTAETGQDLDRTNGLTPASVRYLQILTVNRNTGNTSIAEVRATSPGQMVRVSGTAKDQPPFSSLTALSFSGDHDGVVLPAVATDVFSAGLTFTAWIKPSDATAGKRIFYMGNSADANGALGADDISLQFNGTSNGMGVLVLHALSHTATFTDASVSVNTIPLSSTWVHVAAVVTPGPTTVGLSLFINGALVGTPTTTTMSLPNVARSKCTLGINGFAGQPYIGQMRDIRVWNRPLNITEIGATIGVSLTGGESGLVGWYPCTREPTGSLDVPNRANSTAMGNGLIQTPTLVAYSGQAAIAPTYQALKPLTGIELVDCDTAGTSGRLYTGTLTLSDPTLGILSGTGVTEVTAGSGIYTVTGTGLATTAGTFTDRLRNVLFTPTATLNAAMLDKQRRTARLSLSIADGSAVGPGWGDAMIEIYKGTNVTTLTNAEYWKNTTLTGTPDLLSLVTSFNPVPLPPVGLTNSGTQIVENYSARYTMWFTPTFSGDYRFATRSDDGVRLFVNDLAVPLTIAGSNPPNTNTWIGRGVPTNPDLSPVFTLVAGTPMKVVLEYYQGTGTAFLNGYGLFFRLQRESDGATVDFGSTLTPINSMPLDQPPFCNLQAVNFPGGIGSNSGGNSQVRLPTFRGVMPLTLEAWVRNDRVTPDSDMIFLRSIDGLNMRLRVGWNNNAVLTVDTKASTPLTSNTVMNNDWVHLAAVFSSLSPRGVLYRNGVEASMGDMGLATTDLPAATGEEALLGFGTSGPFRGAMADVRIWRIERTVNEIRDNMSRPLTGNEPGLAAWYLRSNDLGRTLTDQSGRLGAGRIENGANVTVPVVADNVSGVTPRNTVNPFADAVLVDPDTGTSVTATYTYTITIGMDDPLKGALSGSTALQAKNPNGTAPYELQVIGLDAAQAALRTLAFTPADDRGAENVVLSVTINDGHAASSGAYTRTVQVTNLNAGSDQPPFINHPAVYMGSGNASTGGVYGDHVQLPTIPLGPKATVELWAKTDGVLPWWCRLVELTSRRDAEYDAFRLASYEGRGLLRFQNYNWATTCAPSTSAEMAAAPFPLNQWTHVAMVVDNVEKPIATLYVNGQVSLSYPMTRPMSTIDRTIAYLGRSARSQTVSGTNDRYFQGWMKDVRIWSTARNQAQIKGNMTRPVDPADPALIAYYPTVQIGLDGKVLTDRSTTAPAGDALLMNNARFSGVSTIADDEVALPLADVELFDPDTTDTTALIYAATVTQQVAGGAVDTTNTLGTLSAGVGDGAAVTVASGIATIHVAGLANLQAIMRRLVFTPTVQGADDDSVAVANFVLRIQQEVPLLATASVGQVALRIVDRSAAVQDQPPFISISAVRFATNSTTVAADPPAVTLPNLAAGTFVGGNATLECWVKPYDPAENYGRFIHLGVTGSSSNDALMLTQFPTSGLMRGAIFSGASTTVRNLVYSPTSLQQNQWQHVAGVFTTTNVKLYRNGEQAGSSTVGAVALPTVLLNACRLGQDPTVATTRQFRGEISNVRIWTTARTQAQIRNFMTRDPVIPAETDKLIAWYKIKDNVLSNAVNPIPTQAAALVGGATLTGNRPVIGQDQICQPFKDVELVDPDTGPAGTARISYQVRVTIAGGTGQLRASNGAWLTNFVEFTSVGLDNAREALRSVDFQRITTGASQTTLSVTITDLSTTLTSQGVVVIDIIDTAGMADQPTFCSLSALKLDGTTGINRYVALPTTNFTVGRPLTVEAWAKISRTTTAGALWDIGQVNQNVILRLLGNNPYTATWASKVVPGTTTDYTSSVPVTFDTWQHIAVSYNANEICYINGLQVYSRTCPAFGSVLRTLACFGCDNDGASGAKSDYTYLRELKDLRVWAAERSQKQIHDFMTAPITPDATLLAWYRCLENEGTSLANSNATSVLGAATVVGSPEFTGASVGAIGLAGYPFASAELVDPDTGRGMSEATTYDITVTIDLANSVGRGTLSGAGIITAAPGISRAQALLRAMTFTPTTAGAVRFGIVINDHMAASTYTSTATCVVNQDQPVFCNLPAVKFTSDLVATDATGDYVTLPAVGIYGDVTLEAWVKARFVDDGARLFDFSSNGTNRLLVLNQNSESRWRFYVENNATNIADTLATRGYATDTWMHVAAVYQSGASRSALIYQNGQQVGLVTPTVDLIAPSSPRLQSWIGRTTSANRYFRGEMKRFRIWNTARTQAEILGAMTAPVSPTATGLVADYPMAYYDSVKKAVVGDNTLGTTLQNVCTNPAAIVGNATLQNQTRMNTGATISTAAKIFAAAEIIDPDTSDALTANYDYEVVFDISATNIAGSDAGWLSGTGVTPPPGSNVSSYKLSAHGLANLVKGLRDVVFTPKPQTTTAHVQFALSITDGHATSPTRGMVNVDIASGNALPPVPTVAPFLTGPGGIAAVPTVGWTLVCNPGTWSDAYNVGQPTVTDFTYQWYRITSPGGVVTFTAIPAGEQGTVQTRDITETDMGLIGDPVISLICQVTATSAVNPPGLKATAWSNALAVNKYPAVTVINGALARVLSTPNTVALTYTFDQAVEAGGAVVDPATCACKWEYLDPAVPFGSGPSFASTWTAIPTPPGTQSTNVVTLDRSYVKYQFRVRLYTHMVTAADGSVSATGRFSAYADSAPLAVDPLPTTFTLTSDSPTVPTDGGRVDLNVNITDQFNLAYVLSGTQTIIWDWTPQASGDLTAVVLNNPDFSRKLVTAQNITLPAQITVTATLYTARVVDGGVPVVPAMTGQVVLTVVPGNVWKINFQPASSPTVTGWYVDSGKAKGYRGVHLKDSTALNYGWTFGGIETDLSHATRDRNDLRNSAPTVPTSPDDDLVTIKQLYDTCIHTQRLAASDLDPVVYGSTTTVSSDFNPPARWEICLPAGTYTAQIICGDGGYTNSTYAFSVWNNFGLPGQVLVPCIPTLYTPIADGYLGPWNNNMKSGIITVGDTSPLINGVPTPGYGNLVIVNGVGAVNNKLCGVIIQQMSVAN